MCGFLDRDIFLNTQDDDSKVKNVQVIREISMVRVAVTFTLNKYSTVWVELKKKNLTRIL